MNTICLSTGLTDEEVKKLDAHLGRTLSIKQGQHLFRNNAPFQALYAIRSGCFETYTIDSEGNQQVLGFHFAGDILGFDAIYTKAHNNHAVAMETSVLCVIPFNQIRSIASEIPTLLDQLIRLMSREITHDAFFLGHQNAEARMASFMFKVASSLVRNKHCEKVFMLPMPRKDIANYLQLATETVSRIFRKFQELGILDVSGRHVRILKPKALEDIANLRV